VKFHLLYWGSIILGLGNGTVGAHINPCGNTVQQGQSEGLNFARWMAGRILVVGGLCTIALAGNTDWRLT
jgi:hypothetical protein